MPIAFWSDVYPKRTTISNPTTTDRAITIASGLVSEIICEAKLNAEITAAARSTIGFERAVKLLDVSQSTQTFLDFFFRRAALIRQDFFRFFLQHVDHEFVDRFVTRSVRTLLDLIQQFAFNLYFV